MTHKLNNPLGWTEENKPTRESLILNVNEAKREYSRRIDSLYENHEEFEEAENYIYESLAKLEFWDQDFGPRPSETTEDAFRIKRDYLKDSGSPMPTPEEYLASLPKQPEIPEEVELVTGAAYRKSPLEYPFDRDPELNQTMDNLRLKSFTTNVVWSGKNYVPCIYLVVVYPKDKEAEAIRKLSEDLKKLTPYIFGNMSMPKTIDLVDVATLSSPTPKLTYNKALYCWPFVDLHGLAKSVGKDFVNDFKCNEVELLKFLDVGSASQEGALDKSIV